MRDIENLTITEYSVPIPNYDRWVRDSEGKGYISSLPTAHADTAKSLIVIVGSLPPYLPTAEGVEISSFYISSQALNEMAVYDSRGNSAQTPVKPLLAGYGIGAYGKNGIIGIPGIGSRFGVRIIESAAEPTGDDVWNDDYGVSPECADCRICVDNCPTGALPGDSTLIFEKCLRAQANGAIHPIESRALIGGAIWGCEECQRRCPRNANIPAIAMPKELESALELERLLAGDVKPLGEWLGVNYARKAKFQTLAAIIAANLNRCDLTDNITHLFASDQLSVREAAMWALSKLREAN